MPLKYYMMIFAAARKLGWGGRIIELESNILNDYHRRRLRDARNYIARKGTKHA